MPHSTEDERDELEKLMVSAVEHRRTRSGPSSAEDELHKRWPGVDWSHLVIQRVEREKAKL